MKYCLVWLSLILFFVSPQSIFAQEQLNSASQSGKIYPAPETIKMLSLAELVSNGQLSTAAISPASPFFFIRTVKENLEYKFSAENIKSAKKLKFAKNRLSETYSAHKDGREDLIIPIMEEYRNFFNYFYGNPHGKMETVNNFLPDIKLLISLHDQVTTERAKRAIRASIDHLQLNSWKVLNVGTELTLITQFKPDLNLACNFIGKESENQNLNQAERAILTEKFELCLKNFP